MPASGGGVANFLRADGTWAAPPGGSGSASVAQGTVAFGSSPSNYAEVTIAAAWVTAGHRNVALVRGGTADHPLADGDAALESLVATVVGVSAGVSVTIGVHAPNETFGDYLVDIVGAT